MNLHRQVIFLFVAILLVAFLAHSVAAEETIVGDVEDRINAGKVEYEGKEYRPKRRITSVLFMGIDQKKDETETVNYRNGGQADFIVLCVIDDNAKTVDLLHINRDTVTEVQVLSPFGQEMGMWKTQLCRAHSFGDGKEQSCELMVSAVQWLLMGITIDYYISMSWDGISVLNDVLGGVTVTLKDDFSIYDPNMQIGEKVTLQGKQAEYYVRMRFYVGDGSNAMRMERQQMYIANAKDALESQIEKDGGFLNELFEAVRPYITTNMSRGKLINLLERVRRYYTDPIILMDGDYGMDEDGLVTYNVDTLELQRRIINTFYEEIESQH